MNRFTVCPREDAESRRIWAEMMSGKPYDALHPALTGLLAATREKIWEFNSLRPSEKTRQRELLDEILGHHGENFHVNQPFRCDYGINISVGENFFANFNLTILDEAPVEIGDNAFIGPNVSIYTACHPLEAEERAKGTEWALPVKIGNDVWIGGGATILPGVTIGDRCTIGAGAVVTRDIPSDTLAAGNPAPPPRKIREETHVEFI